MHLNTRKGLTLVELLIALLIMAMVTTIAMTVLVYSLQSYGTSTNQITQHNKVLEVTQRIRKDIEEAYIITVTNTSTYSAIYCEYTTESAITNRTWTFDGTDNKLYIQLDEGTREDIVDGLDTSLAHASDPDTRFSRFQHMGSEIYLLIKPLKTNTTIHQNRNINDPIVTEFSVKYKTLITIP